MVLASTYRLLDVSVVSVIVLKVDFTFLRISVESFSVCCRIVL